MDQVQKAMQFAKLHAKGTPVRLYNAWDAGSAKAIADGGAKAIASSSWAVAAAQGYPDGENIPMKFVEEIVGRIVQATELPVTVDCRGWIQRGRLNSLEEYYAFAQNWCGWDQLRGPHRARKRFIRA